MSSVTPSIESGNNTKLKPFEHSKFLVKSSNILIPKWLLSKSSALISSNSKLIYGVMYRECSVSYITCITIKTLSLELGLGKEIIQRSIKQLKENKLIEGRPKYPGGPYEYTLLQNTWMKDEE